MPREWMASSARAIWRVRRSAERDHDGLRVALKVLERRLRKDPVFLERFVREYKLVTSLENEYVARIYDQGFSGENPYIAMEFLPSGTLAGRIHEGLTPLFNALFITSNPIPVKTALEMIGLPVGPPRLPLVPATSEERERIRKALVDAGLL